MEWRTLINQVEEGLNKAWKGGLRFAKDKSMELKAKEGKWKKKKKAKEKKRMMINHQGENLEQKSSRGRNNREYTTS